MRSSAGIHNAVKPIGPAGFDLARRYVDGYWKLLFLQKWQEVMVKADVAVVKGQYDRGTIIAARHECLFEPDDPVMSS